MNTNIYYKIYIEMGIYEKYYLKSISPSLVWTGFIYDAYRFESIIDALYILKSKEFKNFVNADRDLISNISITESVNESIKISEG